jgi:hypothetical protein
MPVNLDYPVPPKETKTLCGLRARYGRIDNVNPTCPDCLAVRQDIKTLPRQ